MGANRNIITIKIELTKIVIGTTEKKSRLLFFVSSAINFYRAIGIPNWLRPIKREKVGRIII